MIHQKPICHHSCRVAIFIRRHDRICQHVCACHDITRFGVFHLIVAQPVTAGNERSSRPGRSGSYGLRHVPRRKCGHICRRRTGYQDGYPSSAVIVPLQARKQAAMVSTVRKQPRAAPGQPYRIRSRRCKSQYPVTQDVLQGLQPGQTLPGNRLIARDVSGLGGIAAGAP